MTKLKHMLGLIALAATVNLSACAGEEDDYLYLAGRECVFEVLPNDPASPDDLRPVLADSEDEELDLLPSEELEEAPADDPTTRITALPTPD